MRLWWKVEKKYDFYSFSCVLKQACFFWEFYFLSLYKIWWEKPLSLNSNKFKKRNIEKRDKNDKMGLLCNKKKLNYVRRQNLTQEIQKNRTIRKWKISLNEVK